MGGNRTVNTFGTREEIRPQVTTSYVMPERRVEYQREPVIEERRIIETRPIEERRVTEIRREPVIEENRAVYVNSSSYEPERVEVKRTTVIEEPRREVVREIRTSNVQPVEERRVVEERRTTYEPKKVETRV